MKLYKKIFAGILALSMMTTFMSGCSSNNGNDTEDNNSASVSEDTTNDGVDDNADTSDNNSSQVGGSEDNSIPDNLDYTDEITEGVVMTVGGYDIDIEEYRYYFLNLKGSFDGNDDTYWDGEATEGTDEEGNDISQTVDESKRQRLKDLKDYVTVFLINNYCVEKLAKDNNIELTAEELQEVENSYNETKTSYESDDSVSYSTFEEYLASTYCDKDLYIKSLTRQKLEEKLVRSLYEEDFRANLLPEYNHCQHILFSTMNLQAETQEVPEDAADQEKERINAQNEEILANAKEDIKNLAEEVLQKIKDGADFEEMVVEYNEDPGQKVNQDGSVEGYYFKQGTMVTEFEDAFFALNDNEVSDVVETDYGYHIIKRLPITDDDAYINENIVTLIMQDPSTGETTEYYDKYMELADQYYDSMDITYNDIYYNVNTISVPEQSSVFENASTPKTEDAE